MVYKLKTPNPLYNGVTEGVAFVKGLGETTDKNIRNVLVNDYKYEDISEDAPKKENPEKSIDEMTVPELKEKAKELELTGFSNLKRNELIALIKGEPPKDDGENLEDDKNNNDSDGNENPPDNNEDQ